MVIPGMRESTKVINVDLCVFHIMEDIIHDFLNIIRGAM
jgi:hypothetical protein